MIQENKEKYYVIYKNIEGGREVQRKYVLPNNNLNTFFKLAKRFKNFFIKQEALNNMMNQVVILLDDRNDELKIKEVCDSVYSLPENYIKFVAMDITKQKFYYYVKERISKLN